MAGSNRSNDIVILNNVRIAGVRGDQPGQQFGGNYIPAHQGQNGPVSARFDTNLYINHPPRRLDNGQTQEVEADIIRLVIWNSPNNKGDGKGQADNAAKILSLGKELSCFARIRSYLGQVYNNQGQPVNNPDGSPIKVRKIAFHIVPGSMILGADSDKQLTAEINAWLQMGGIQGFGGQIRFDARPQFWNTSGQHPDKDLWKQILAGRMAAVYHPQMTTFGYARVVPARQASNMGYNGGLSIPSISPEGVAYANQFPAMGGGYPQAPTPQYPQFQPAPANQYPQVPVQNFQAPTGYPTAMAGYSMPPTAGYAAPTGVYPGSAGGPTAGAPLSRAHF